MTHDEAAPDSVEKAVVRKIVFRLFPFMIILTMINFLDRVNIGYAALTMNRDLGIDPAVFGLAAGMFFIGYVLFEIPSNILLHKVGANVWLCRIMVTWGFVSMGMAFVTGATSLYVLRLLLGLAEAGFIPGITLYILLWVPLRQRARLTGLWILATPFAGILGGPLSGLLLQLDGAWGLHGWQWLFIAEGLPAVIMGMATFFYLTPTPSRARWLSEDERGWLVARLAAEGEVIRGAAQRGHSIGKALLNWRVLVLGLLYIGMNMGLSGINNWLPTIIKSLGSLSNLEAASLTAVPWACAAVAAVLWGRRSDRRDERYVSLAIPLLIGAAGFAASAYTSSPLLGIVCLSVATMGIIAGYAVFWVLPGTFLTGVAAAAGIALINSMGNVGGFIAPFTIGWIRQETGSFTYALLVLAFGMAAAGVLAIVMRPARHSGAALVPGAPAEGIGERAGAVGLTHTKFQKQEGPATMTSKTRNCFVAALAALAGTAGGTGSAQAQAAAQQQYVVIYGELAPTFSARLNGEFVLNQLARLARTTFGAQYFTVNFEIGRPNFFNITEVWSSATAYAAFTGASNTQHSLASLQPLLIAPLDERDGNLVTP